MSAEHFAAGDGLHRWRQGHSHPAPPPLKVRSFRRARRSHCGRGVCGGTQRTRKVVRDRTGATAVDRLRAAMQQAEAQARESELAMARAIAAGRRSELGAAGRIMSDDEARRVVEAAQPEQAELLRGAGGPGKVYEIPGSELSSGFRTAAGRGRPPSRNGWAPGDGAPRVARQQGEGPGRSAQRATGCRRSSCAKTGQPHHESRRVRAGYPSQRIHQRSTHRRATTVDTSAAQPRAKRRREVASSSPRGHPPWIPLEARENRELRVAPLNSTRTTFSPSTPTWSDCHATSSFTEATSTVSRSRSHASSLRQPPRSTWSASFCAEEISPGSGANNILHYRDTIRRAFPRIVKFEVFLPRFGLRLRPWSEWKKKEGVPLWWSDYNKVKHERNAYFERANLKNVLNAVAGLFVMVLYLYGERAGLGALEPPPQVLHVTREHYIGTVAGGGGHAYKLEKPRRPNRVGQRK